MDTRTAFCCKECGVAFTDFLRPVSENSLRLTIGSAALPAGHFVRLSDAWRYHDFLTGRSANEHYQGADRDVIVFESGDYLLHIADVRHVMVANAAFGCCGYQPRDEINANCPNGHPLGTVHSDCWAASVFRLSFRHVVLVEV